MSSFNRGNKVGTQTRQPEREPEEPIYRPWSYGLCECCSDCGECLMVTLCPLVYASLMTLRAKEMPIALCVGGLVPLRTKIRTERNIKGSIVEDCCCSFFCPCCLTVQMSLESRDTEPLL